MKETLVKEIRKLITVEPAIVLENDSIQKIIDIFIGNPVTRAVYVVDKKDSFIGIITIQDILKKISLDSHSLSSLYSSPTFTGYNIALSVKDVTAGDIMDPEVYFVHDDDPIEEAFNLLFKNKAGEIPVVDENDKLVGDLNVIELLVLWKQNQE